MIETYRGVAFPWLVDQMGHLNTAKYVEMFDVALYHLMHHLGVTLPGDGRMGWADVRHEIDYKAEVRTGALVLIRSGIIETRRTSFRARHVMTDPDCCVVHAVMHTVTVHFDLEARAAAPLPTPFISVAATLLIPQDDR